MAAVKDRHVSDQHIFTKLKRDGLVAEAHRAVFYLRAETSQAVRPGMRIAAHLVKYSVPANQLNAADHAVAGDENVREIFAPDEAVVKITMAAVLIRIVRRPRLGEIIGLEILRCGQDRRARVNNQMDVALEMNRAAQISSRRNQNRSAPGSGSGLNGPVDGGAVKMLPVAARAEAANVESVVRLAVLGHGRAAGQRKN